MKIKNYKIIDDGIWIPRSELVRMIEDLYKAAIGYDKARKENGDCAYESAMLRAQGGAEAYEYLYKQLEERSDINPFVEGALTSEEILDAAQRMADICKHCND